MLLRVLRALLVRRALLMLLVGCFPFLC